jgi:hypothetical protein
MIEITLKRVEREINHQMDDKGMTRDEAKVFVTKMIATVPPGLIEFVDDRDLIIEYLDNSRVIH